MPNLSSATAHASTGHAGPFDVQRRAAPDSANTAAVQVGEFDGLRWTWRNGFDKALGAVSASAWADPAGQGWTLVKQNSSREVWRAVIQGCTYYVKYYSVHGLLNRIKRRLRGPACLSEWQGGMYALRAAVPAVRPAGFSEHLDYKGRDCSLLVTEAATAALPLDEFWTTLQSDRDASRRRADADHLFELLGSMIAHAHQSGFEHLDMHAANILVQPTAPRTYRTLFVDLQSARLGSALSDQAVVRNLAQLNQWFRKSSTAADRIRFLRAYLRWRNEHELRFDHSRRLGLTFEQLVRSLRIRADEHAERLWAQRDRRARRDGRYFGRVRLPDGWRAVVTVSSKRTVADSRASGLVLSRQWWKQVLASPLEWFAPERADACKDSHSGMVTRAVLEVTEGGHVPVIVKRPKARNWMRALRQWLPPSRSRRGWRMGHALLHRDLPTARPLALLERRVGPLVLDSMLLTEAAPGATDLEAFLRSRYKSSDRVEWHRTKREICARLASELRRLQERGLSHRDCKAGNILVVPPHDRLMWIDMDGLRVVGRRRAEGDLRPVARLFVSLREVPGLSRSDAARVLKAYCARFGAAENAWRGAWREVADRMAEKLARQTGRREWKLRHYGRV